MNASTSKSLAGLIVAIFLHLFSFSIYAEPIVSTNKILLTKPQTGPMVIVGKHWVIQNLGGDLVFLYNDPSIVLTDPSNPPPPTPILKIKKGSSKVTLLGGIEFGDGTVQSTAQLRGANGANGADGASGRPGPAGPPVKSVSICTSQGSSSNPGYCSCTGRQLSRVTNQYSCTATSDTGTCSGTGIKNSSGGITSPGSCCVCAAQ